VVATTKGPEFWRAYNAKNKIRRTNTTKEWQRRIREEVIAHYGGKCECCLDRTFEFLTVEREEGSGRSRVRRNLAYWLHRNGLPPGYRVRCHNCSEAHRRFGYCPHRDVVV
jgi:hypothetical protein